jgi:hypothetical protein
MVVQVALAAAVTRVEDGLDWLAPDYPAVFHARARRLAKLRADPNTLAFARAHYRENIADFISDWGCTTNPKNPELGVMPFVLFPRQREFIDFVLRECWANKESGIIDKSRDIGASWLCIAIAVSLCLLHKNIKIGFGSRKEELVDASGDPDSLFWKARTFLQYLPVEFVGTFDLRKHSSHRRLLFPWNNSAMTGEAGDNIGRGGRSSIFFVDESAYLERPKLIDASLAATTDCRIDVSSVNGMANSFAERRHSGNVKVFTYHYRDDPRKTPEWAAKKQRDLDAVVWAAEYEINYTASVEGIIIPALWVSAAVDAHVKLGITPTGSKRGALDVADTGRDKNAFGVKHGVVLTHSESWKGSGDFDIFHTVERAFMLADQHGLDEFAYDADGLGAGVRGDARKVNEARAEAAGAQKAAASQITVTPHRGSAAVFRPESIVPGTERRAEDYFENYKAQSWFSIRERFKLTHRVITGEVTDYDPSDIISLSSEIAELSQLKNELSQPTWKASKSGKLMVEKTPDGTMSPNLADEVVMLFAPRHGPMVIDADVLAAFSRRR